MVVVLEDLKVFLVVLGLKMPLVIFLNHFWRVSRWWPIIRLWGEDLRYDLTITLEEAAKGSETLSYFIWI